MPPRAKTDTLPAEIKAAIYGLHQKGAKLTDIADAVNELLMEQDAEPILNKDNIHRMLQKRGAALQKMQQSKQVAEMVVAKFGENNDIGKSTEAIVGMGQALIMDLMMDRAENPGKNVELNIDRLASSLQSFVGALMKQQQFEERIQQAIYAQLTREAQKVVDTSPEHERHMINVTLQKIGIKLPQS